MKAMILAAGLGTRMRHLTADRPKPLVPVLGRTLIDRTLDRVAEIGVTKAVVNLHYRPDMLRAHLTSREASCPGLTRASISPLDPRDGAEEWTPGSSPGVTTRSNDRRENTLRIAFSDETDRLLETGGGVARALPMLGDAPFLVANSDNIWIGERAFMPLLERWDPEAMDALLLLVPVARTVGYGRAGDFSLDGGRLVRRGAAPTAPYVFTGAQVLSPALFRDCPEGPFSLNLLWDRAIAAGRAFGVVHPGRWCDVGTPEGLAAAEEALR